MSESCMKRVMKVAPQDGVASVTLEEVLSEARRAAVEKRKSLQARDALSSLSKLFNWSDSLSWSAIGAVSVDDTLLEMPDTEVLVSHLFYIKAPIKSSRGFPVNHEYLVLIVSYPIQIDGEVEPATLILKAEKNDKGIWLRRNTFDGTERENIQKYAERRAELVGCLPASVQWVDLLRPLVAYDTSYDFVGDNCRNYTSETWTALLKLFKEKSAPTEPAASELLC